MGRKRKNNVIPKVHPELEGLNLSINEFGEMTSNLDIDKINEFLTRTVPDKKLINRNDDKYQQEFKELGLGGEGDDEDVDYVEPEEEEEDTPDKLFKDIDDEDLPPIKPKKK